jgi:hypothetical protein
VHRGGIGLKGDQMKGLLGRLIARGVEDGEDVILRPSRQFTRQDIGRIAERGATEFRSRDMNLISCFGPLEGEFGLYATLSNFIQTKRALTAEINEAVVDGDEVELTLTFVRAMEYAFITLYEKNALARLQLVENLPAEAAVEYARMRQSVGTTAVPVAARAAAQAPVAPLPPIDPIDQCVLDYKGDKANGVSPMQSNAFKIKWVNNQSRRPVWDEVVRRNLV